MKSKTTAIIFLIFLVFLIACKQTTKQQISPQIDKTATAPTTGDVAVDSVGKDINSVDSVEKDLNADQLDDLDAGLQDIQNI